MLVLNLPFKALMFLTLMRPSLVLFLVRSEERFSRNAETDLVCRLLLEKKKRRPIGTAASAALVTIKRWPRWGHRTNRPHCPTDRLLPNGSSSADPLYPW